MMTKHDFDDVAGAGFAIPFHPLVNILRRTEPALLEDIKELLDLQARQIGRPIVVLPRNPETIH